ncbi:MAG: hypothetical protein ACFFCZ_24920 [Promethearchaeota archaeon]
MTISIAAPVSRTGVSVKPKNIKLTKIAKRGKASSARPAMEALDHLSPR